MPIDWPGACRSKDCASKCVTGLFSNAGHQTVGCHHRTICISFTQFLTTRKWIFYNPLFQTNRTLQQAKATDPSAREADETQWLSGSRTLTQSAHKQGQVDFNVLLAFGQAARYKIVIYTCDCFSCLRTNAQPLSLPTQSCKTLTAIALPIHSSQHQLFTHNMLTGTHIRLRFARESYWRVVVLPRVERVKGSTAFPFLHVDRELYCLYAQLRIIFVSTHEPRSRGVTP